MSLTQLTRGAITSVEVTINKDCDNCISSGNCDRSDESHRRNMGGGFESTQPSLAQIEEGQKIAAELKAYQDILEQRNPGMSSEQRQTAYELAYSVVRGELSLSAAEQELQAALNTSEKEQSEIQKRLESKFNLTPEQQQTVDQAKSKAIEQVSTGTERLGKTGSFRIEETTEGKIDLINAETGVGILASFVESNGEGDLSKSTYESIIQQLVDNHYLVLEAHDSDGKVIAYTYFECGPDNTVTSWMTKVVEKHVEETPQELKAVTKPVEEEQPEPKPIAVTPITSKPAQAPTAKAHAAAEEKPVEKFEQQDDEVDKPGVVETVLEQPPLEEELAEAQVTVPAPETVNFDTAIEDASQAADEDDATQTAIASATGFSITHTETISLSDISPAPEAPDNGSPEMGSPDVSDANENVFVANIQTEKFIPISLVKTTADTRPAITIEQALVESTEQVTAPIVAHEETAQASTQEGFVTISASKIIESLFAIHETAPIAQSVETVVHTSSPVETKQEATQTHKETQEKVEEQEEADEEIVAVATVVETQSIAHTESNTVETAPIAEVSGITLIETPVETAPKHVEHTVAAVTEQTTAVFTPEDAPKPAPPVLKINSETGETVMDSQVGISLVISEAKQLDIAKSMFRVESTQISPAPHIYIEQNKVRHSPIAEKAPIALEVTPVVPEVQPPAPTNPEIPKATSKPEELLGINPVQKEQQSFLHIAREQGVGTAVLIESLNLLQEGLKAFTELGRKPETGHSHELRGNVRKHVPTDLPVADIKKNVRRPISPRGAVSDRRRIKLAA